MLIRTAGLPFTRLEQLSVDWNPAERALAVAEDHLARAIHDLQRAFDVALRALPHTGLRTAVYNARKAFFQRQKVPDTTRLAMWPEKGGHAPELARLLAAVEACRKARQTFQDARDDFDAQYTAALIGAYEALQTIAREDGFQRSLLFSSHALLEQLHRFTDTPARQFSKKERQMALAVLQYASRMAIKTSPLSHLTTVAVYVPGREVPEAPFGKSMVSPNVALLEAIYTVLLREPTFYQVLPARLNPCIVAPAEREYEWLFYNGVEEGFQTVASDPLLQYVVELLLDNQRQMPFDAIVRAVSAVADAGPAEVEAYVLELLDTGFLEWVLPESGLSPDWCAGLYRFLGFLPAAPPVVETLELLQWLRATARALPNHAVMDAVSAQQAAAEQVRHYLARHGLGATPIPPEQLFFEDVEQPFRLGIPWPQLQLLINQLATAWRQRPEKPLPTQRAALSGFLDGKTQSGQAVDFLAFCREYLSGLSGLAPATLSGRGPEKIGALFQVFESDGCWYAVVNGLFPGGGKLFARWLHLFPAGVRHALQKWLAKSCSGADFVLQYPWQGYFNANFQPALTAGVLAVPGGRLPAPGHDQDILLGNVEIIRGDGAPVLRDRLSGRVFKLTDTGLEALETRPPAMQVLWQLGVPYVSVDALAPEDCWTPLQGDTIRFRPRYCVGNVVFARASWVFEPEAWSPWLRELDAGFFRHVRRELSVHSAPRHFFAHLPGEKPQYFDLNSPALLLLFCKMLQGGRGALTLVEALPLPPGGHGERVQEYVVEFAV
ncbi:MAG: lantibiotic dehydratase [Saprospirales bacterium]|nr:lantibiotic dehydratase [Saprospirales bacterium]